MNLQDALISAELTSHKVDLAEVERLQREFNLLYKRYIGEGRWCKPTNYPPIVRQSWEKLQKAKGASR